MTGANCQAETVFTSSPRDLRRSDDGYSPLAGYAAIGDGRTVALVAMDGRIDWLPVPAIDDSPMFAALLDAEHGGSLSLSPVDEARVRRRYVPDTNVLETTWTTSTGTVVVHDALVTGVAGRLPWMQLEREVIGRDGEVEMAWAVVPGTALRTTEPEARSIHGKKIVRVGEAQIAVVTDSDQEDDGSEPVFRGRMRTSPGSSHTICVVGSADRPLPVPDVGVLSGGVARTIREWQEWSRAYEAEGPWSDHVRRSALVLKLLIFTPTGAIAAAATTSLPERASGGKNWDYRFAWVRDLLLTVRALTRFSLREETQAAVDWLLETVSSQHDDMPIFFTLRGKRMDRVVRRDAPGWRGISPVVEGNRASSQSQLGVYGEIFWIIREFSHHGGVLDLASAALLERLAGDACERWRDKDSGMWELTDLEHHTSSKMGCWLALDAAVELHDAGQITGDRALWQSERDAIKEWIDAHCWNETVGAYTMFPDTTRLDASVLLYAMAGFDRGERMRSTIDAVRRHLHEGAGVFRFSGAQEEESPFVACGFWLVSALACVGEIEEATELMHELVGLCNDVGMFAEMVTVDGREFMGNIPQALSHLALINAAIDLEQAAARH